MYGDVQDLCSNSSRKVRGEIEEKGSLPETQVPEREEELWIM